MYVKASKFQNFDFVENVYVKEPKLKLLVFHASFDFNSPTVISAYIYLFFLYSNYCLYYLVSTVGYIDFKTCRIFSNKVLQMWV